MFRKIYQHAVQFLIALAVGTLTGITFTKQITNGLEGASADYN